MKVTYIGMRRAGIATVYVSRGKRLTPLRIYPDVANHSPTGHEWGYGGSGPAQTAADVLYHATRDANLAALCCHDFKWAFIARLDRDNWRLPQSDVLDYVAGLDKCMRDRLAVLNAIESPWQATDPGELVNLMEDYPDGQQTPP